MAMSSMRDALRDERVPAVAARVAVHDGETSHFTVNDEGDLIVSVVTAGAGVPLWANLHGVDKAGHGQIWIPAVGTEVIVIFDDGNFEGEAYIAASYPSGSARTSWEPGTLYLVADKVSVTAHDVRISDGSGGEQPLVTKAEFDAHTHPTGVGPSSPPTTPITGTTVLKAQ